MSPYIELRGQKHNWNGSEIIHSFIGMNSQIPHSLSLNNTTTSHKMKIVTAANGFQQPTEVYQWHFQHQFMLVINVLGNTF
jgi:hypothetical protein